LDVEGVTFAKVGHPRAGDLILVANLNKWFDYRWWSQADEAPVFAKMVDIHRKPGYDPCELFWDRSINGVSQNPALVKGSHGIASAAQAICIGDFRFDMIAADQLATIFQEMLGTED
jgi:hypothetical protein